jgi:hypothetical protein
MTIYRVLPGNLSGDGSTWAEAFGTLDEALSVSGLTADDEIRIGTGGAARVKISPPETALTTGIKIYGGFLGQATVADALELSNYRNPQRYKVIVDGGGTSRGFPGGFAASVTIDGLQFVDCYDASYGGAIHVDNYDNWTIKNCVFRSCITEGTGGALRGSGCTGITIDGCTFGICTAAEKGGAVYLTSSTGVIKYSRFSGNIASDSGGAIYIHSSAVSPYITIQRCIIDHNESVTTGGGVEVINGSLVYITLNTICHNKAGTYGGGVHTSSGASECYLYDNILYYNTAVTSGNQVYGANVVAQYNNVQGGFTGTGNIDELPPFRTEGEHPYDITDSYPGNDAASDSVNGYLELDYRGRSEYNDLNQGSDPGANPELWTDGDLEDGVVTDYTPTTWCSRTLSYAPYCHTGSKGLRITPTGNYLHPERYVLQTHGEVGKTYQISLWALTGETQGPYEHFRIKKGGDADGTGGVGIWYGYLTLSTWVYIEATFTINSTEETEIYIGNNDFAPDAIVGHDFWIDDVSLKEVVAETSLCDMGAYEYQGSELDHFDTDQYNVKLTVDTDESGGMPFCLYGAFRIPFEISKWNEYHESGNLMGIAVSGEIRITGTEDRLEEYVHTGGKHALRATADTAVADPSWTPVWSGGDASEPLSPTTTFLTLPFDDGSGEAPVVVVLKIKLHFETVDHETYSIRIFNYAFAPFHTDETFDPTDYEVDPAWGPPASGRYDPDAPVSAAHVDALIRGYLKILSEAYSPLTIPVFGKYQLEGIIV